MADNDFKLPHSSFGELKKLIIAFAKSRGPSSLDDLNKLTGINKTIISSNNGFLESIKAVSGGNKKESTEVGKKLGMALANNIETEISAQLRTLLESNEFIESMITALGIKPRSKEDFQSHIAYSLGKELKGRTATGTGTLIELFQESGKISEKEGLLYPNEDQPSASQIHTTIKNDEPVKDQGVNSQSNTTIARDLAKDLGGNVTLNINIQLTIPDTDNEEVYEKFFQAMKKNLLS